MDNQVDIYWTFPCSVTDQDISILNEKEQLQARAFRFEKHRKLYLASHFFLRQVLSHYVPILPSAWQYNYNKFGKPSISNKIRKPIFFNLSHTEGMIVCAISRTNEVGVDVEKVRPLSKINDMSRYCLHDLERLEVDCKLTRQDKERQFLTYWTLKEAALKAWGEGLSTPLQNLCMTKGAKNQWALNITSQLPEESKDLKLRAFQFEKGYQLAIAAQTSQAFRSNQIFTVFITDANSSDSSCWNSVVLTS